MARLATIFVTAGIVMWASGASAQHSEVVQKGEKVYTAQKCQMCHSIAGKGNQKGALDDVGQRLTADEIRLWLTDAKGMTAKTKATRKPEMRAYDLPKERVDELVAYLLTLKKK